MLTIGFALLFLAGGVTAQPAPDPRQETLNRVRSLAEEFDQFKDKHVAAEALVFLGSVTCRYDQPIAANILQSVAALVSADLVPKAYEQVRATLARTAAGVTRASWNRCSRPLSRTGLCLPRRQFFEDGLPEDAISSLAVAKAEAGKLEPIAKPNVLLPAAKLEASLDAEAALTTLARAVAAFNELDESQEEPHPKPGEPRKSRTRVGRSGVSESLTADRAFSTVRLGVARIDGYSFVKALPAFAYVEPERLDAIIADLRAERRLAEGQCAVMELRLARALGGQPD
jgi:hypothetical protein